MPPKGDLALCADEGVTYASIAHNRAWLHATLSAQQFMFKLVKGSAHLGQNKLIGNTLIYIRRIPIEYWPIIFRLIFSHQRQSSRDVLPIISLRFLPLFPLKFSSIQSACWH